jgi:hypothetical protein
MQKLTLIAIAACFLGAPTVMAAPIPSAGVLAISSDDGLIVKTAYHSHKNMKRVHKAQGKGGKM